MKNKFHYLVWCMGLLCGQLFAQPKPQTFKEDFYYFQPDYWTYTLNPTVPTPASELGFEVGQQQVNWEQTVAYMQKLAAVSPRISIQEYGRTHENRPLICVVITSEKNQENLETLRKAHQQLADPAANPDLNALPAVVSVMNSIHGNEASGVNSSLPFAYFFAAAEGKEVQDVLDNTIITLIPGQNPDGITRFSTWVNANRSLYNVTDPQSREFGETWPGGRSNHYWHDMNRDWVNATQPEMKALLAIYHDWMPNIVNDHHEMGTNSTFFLEPADAVGYYPFIPEDNKQLTARVTAHSMQGLDRKGSLYLSKDMFDSYSLGTGDVYGDALGSIALLFEQASSRGHQQENSFGILTFPFAIRNQITCAYGSVQAGAQMRDTLNTYTSQFVKEQAKKAASQPVKGYLFDGNGSEAVSFHFIELLKAHRFKVSELAKTTTVGGQTFEAGKAYVVPVYQPHFMFLNSLFEQQKEFKDILFYDLSTWNMAEAYGLNWAPVKSIAGLTGQAVDVPQFRAGTLSGGKSNYAYLFDNKEWYAPRMITALQAAGIKVMVSGSGLTSRTGFSYGPGMLIVPVAGQTVSADSIYTVIQKESALTGVDVRAVNSSEMKDFDLGHFMNRVVQQPKVAILTGRSFSSAECGALWQLMDYRFQMKPVLIDEAALSRADLSRYNVLILPGGEPAGGEAVEKKIADWVNNGGTLITTGNGYRLPNKAKLTTIKTKKLADVDSAQYVPFDERADKRSMYTIPGTNLQYAFDTRHPLGWGYTQNTMPVMKNTKLVFEMPSEVNKAPVWYDKQDPLLSGFIRPEHKQALAGMPGVIVEQAGKGHVICFADNLNFRSSWLAGTRMFMNAVLFGNMM